ncbi:Reverse transcriptase RNA-dependent DNA polymerase [Trinorchestia longiramus]|nr:Reverse transcriptase RNA-dependent DNA polymerase [Trinorchestia longiramus]
MIEDEFIAVDNPAELKQRGKTDEAEAELKPGTVPEWIQNETHLDEKPTRRFPLRKKKPPIYLKDYVDPDECDITNHVVDYCYRVSSIPKSYSEAISSPDSVEWQKAMSDEMAALVDNETFELVAKPKERSVIGGRWVYSVKSGPNVQEILKARYVAKGYSQVADVDFTETFSPTARLTSVRMLMDIAVQRSYIVHQMDVCTAYLHAKIDCNIFVEQPEGLIELDKNGKKLVYKLKKSLYGLKQSGRNCNNLLHQFLVEQNFVQLLSDTSIYVRESNSGKVIIIVWVDDLILASSNAVVLREVKRFLSNRFKMKDLGPISCFLGIEFVMKQDSIEMKQSKNVEKILSKFRMSDCNPKSIPCDPSANKLDVSSDSKNLCDPKLFREIVGSLIYLMTCTRPDICYVVTLLSQHLTRPTNAHLNLCKFVLKYLKGTILFGLKFVKSENPMQITGFSDSHWGGSSDRKSISGYVFKSSSSSSLISWNSKKQNIVALSSCEAEYIALTYAVQEGIFLKQLLCDMDGYDDPVGIFVDNRGAIDLAKNALHHQRSKHIDIRYHFI